MRIFVIPLLILNFSALACELTPEYIKLRSEVTKEIRESYRSCLKATKAHFFYKAVARCIEEGRGKNIGGGCYHVVGYEVIHEERELEHCKILEPTIEQSIEYLQVVAKEKGITKCLK